MSYIQSKGDHWLYNYIALKSEQKNIYLNEEKQIKPLRS